MKCNSFDNSPLTVNKKEIFFAVILSKSNLFEYSAS